MKQLPLIMAIALSMAFVGCSDGDSEPQHVSGGDTVTVGDSLPPFEYDIELLSNRWIADKITIPRRSGDTIVANVRVDITFNYGVTRYMMAESCYDRSYFGRNGSCYNDGRCKLYGNKIEFILSGGMYIAWPEIVRTVYSCDVLELTSNSLKLKFNGTCYDKDIKFFADLAPMSSRY